MARFLPVTLSLVALAVVGGLLFSMLLASLPCHDTQGQQKPAGQQSARKVVPVQVQQSRPAAAESSSPPLRYVGRQTCIPCHQEQNNLWLGSHHDLAMQEANAQTVLGDFDNTQFTYFGLTSTFYKQDGKYWVRTDGPDGQLRDYEIAYTFGAVPLQQYLIAFPDGRSQALSIVWDSRPTHEGGQRWFHLYPNEKISHDDILHWTGLNQNWNYMCAECHSTNLQKNYDPQHNRYTTTWAEIDVSCEACHGPGSQHVAWAEGLPAQSATSAHQNTGLLAALRDHDTGAWLMDAQSGTARRTPPRTSQAELETCARCHSRRRVLSEDYVPGRPLLDTHVPALLTERLYHPDGQIKEEVYVYGSFLQSKMYQAGVTCSDCHEPHSLTLRAPGDQVCQQCHLAEKYDSPSHHFHPPDCVGASCITCHMPATTYMVVDPRHDHSLRIPRPDLSVKLGTPNACTSCHADQSAEWATRQVQEWYKTPMTGYQDYAEVLHAGRTGAPSAQQDLIRLATNTSQPTIARATALAALQRYLSAISLPALQHSLHAGDSLLRSAAVNALEALEPRGRLSLLLPLLKDPVRAVRIQAARLLASAPVDQLPNEQAKLLERTIAEYIATQRTNAERPEAQLNLGALYAARGQLRKAQAAYQTALQLQATFIPVYINLADLYRLQEKDADGEHILRSALIIAPNNAEVQHALGLLLVRQKRLPEAIESLAQAATLNLNNPRYAYVYAVALQSFGKGQDAITVLEKSHTQHPSDREILYALVTMHRDHGDKGTAHYYAEKLLALAPQDSAVQHLLEQLQ